MNRWICDRSHWSALVVLVCVSLPAWAQMDTTFTYQGQLKERGDLVTDVVDMRFTLWNAATGGAALGSNYTPAGGVNVLDGLFTVQIDSTRFGATGFNGDPRWLQIEIYVTGTGWVALTPRQPITPAPYALYAAESGDDVDPLWETAGSNIFRLDGNVGIGTNSPTRKLQVTTSTASDAVYFSNAGNGNALQLSSSGTGLLASGQTRGVTAWAFGVGASAIFGGSDATTGSGAGVYGQSNSIDGRGVYGYGVATSGDNAGVYGVTESTDGYGVWGVANATSGSAEGGRFVSNATSGRGVYGSCAATTGLNYGVLGVVQSTSGVGVYGAPQATSGSTVGVRGTTRSPSGVGVKGEALAGSGASYGVYGSSDGGSDSVGVYGVNTYGYGGYFSSGSGTAGRFSGRAGVVIDHNAGSSNTAGLLINTAGTEEPVGIDVNVDGSFGRLANFNLNGATGYGGTAFTIAADNSGPVVDIIGENAEVGTEVLCVRSSGHAGAIWAYSSRDSSDAPSITGYHVSNVSNHGVGVRCVGGYKGVEGRATGGDGTGTKYGVYGYAENGATNYAGYFSGNLRCTGTLTKGSGTFMIDHPLDPKNKYLYHSFVESPDMMNIYNGNVVTDGNGYATVTMPDWFEALNRDFRYQLTVIDDGDEFVLVKIVREIEGNTFVLRSSRPNTKVSWQVTGVRHDPYANAHRVQVEVDKPEDEVGTYLHPEEWGVSSELQLDRVREARRAAETQAIEIE